MNKISLFINKLNGNLKLKNILFYCVQGALLAYLFSIPSFSGRTPYNLIAYALMAILTIFVAVYWIIYKPKVKLRFRLLLLPIFIAWALIPTIIYSHEYREWFSFVLLGLSFFIFYFTFAIVEDIRRIVYILLVALGLFTLYFLFVYRNQLGNVFKSTLRLGAYFDNPNAVGAYGAIGIISTIFLFTKKKSNYEYFLLVPLVLFILLGYLSGSRTFLVALVVTVLTFLILRYKTKPLILLCIIIGTIAVFFIVINLPFMANMKKKLLESLYTVLGLKLEDNIRVDNSSLTRVLWQKFAFELASKNIVIGYGVNGFSIYSNVGTYSHGELSELLCNFGFIGFLLFYSNILIPFIFMGPCKNKYKDIVAPIFVFYTIQLVLGIFDKDKLLYFLLALMFFITNDVELYKGKLPEYLFEIEKKEETYHAKKSGCKQKINIACNYSYAFGGNFIPSIIEIAKRVRDQNYDVVISFPKKCETFAWISYFSNLNINTMFFDDSSRRKIVFGIRKITKKEQCDLLYVYNINEYDLLDLKALLDKVKIVCFSNETNIQVSSSSFTNKVKKKVLSNTAIVYASKKSFDKSIYANKHYLKNALFTDRGSICNDEVQNIIKLSTNEKDYKVLTFALDSNNSNAINVVKAFNNIKYEISNLKLIVVYSMSDLGTNLPLLLNKNGVYDFANIVFVPTIENVGYYYSIMDLFIGISNSELISNSLLEVLNLNKKIIVSGEYNDELREYNNNISIANDVDSMALKIKEAYSSNNKCKENNVQKDFDSNYYTDYLFDVIIKLAATAKKKEKVRKEANI